jgi:hypothetical protein
VVLAAARGRTRPGVKVLARFEFTLMEEAGPDASPEDDPAYALADRLDTPVRSGALDGYVLLPDAAAGGRALDAFVARSSRCCNGAAPCGPPVAGRRCGNI